ncbi:MAG: sugar transferase [Candidatus Krumholzibacteriota bacterium]
MKRRNRSAHSDLAGRSGATATAMMPHLEAAGLQDQALDSLSARLETAAGPGLDLKRMQGSLYPGVKRLFDIVVSLLALAIFGLMLPALMLIIKLDSPGPTFYSQERVGLNRRRQRHGFTGKDRRKVLQPGRPFKVIKLRTMGTNAESSGPQWARVNDVRVTRVGKFLRRSRLDEVPQFLNVLRGEMSIIGPRPERMVFVRQLEKEIPNYRDRLLVLPGITGLAQVINGYDDTIESVRRKVELDRRYIKNAGFKQDGSILVSTVSVVLKGEGAR